jgi:hypothetical protein
MSTNEAGASDAAVTKVDMRFETAAILGARFEQAPGFSNRPPVIA